MKKICLALTFSCFISMAFAQTNTVDVGFWGLFLRTINLSYEKATTKNQSFQIKAGYTIPRGLPSFFIELDETSTQIETTNKFSAVSVVGEYRFYVKRDEALRGFYVAPFVKYNNYSLEFSDNVEGIDYVATGGLNTFSLGGQIGYQWLIGDKFVIDWGFLGLGVARNSFSVKYETNDLNADLHCPRY